MGEGRGGGVKEASGIFSHLPFSKGGQGGISEICYHFAHKFIRKGLIPRKKRPASVAK